jgi:thiamine-phosphate pyrophosphorylase
MHPRLATLRLVAITTPTVDAHHGVAEHARRAADLAIAYPPGALLIQVRCKELDGAQLAELTRAIMAAARPHGALIMVNDRLDVALACGADGVHLPERGLAVADAREIATPAGLLIGCSRHRVDTAFAAAADGADLVQLGPIWATPSKLGLGEPLGLEVLTAAKHALGMNTCLVAVGGIDRWRAAAASAAGADAIAAIRAAWDGNGQSLTDA